MITGSVRGFITRKLWHSSEPGGEGGPEDGPGESIESHGVAGERETGAGRIAASAVIYPGFGKTGTSALQAVLRCNCVALSSAGFAYRGDPDEGNPGAIASGNGAELGLALAWEADDPAVTLALDQLLAGDQKAIISSEWLGELDPDQWRRLLDLLVARTRSRRVVVVVRDVYPLVQARYSQAVKGEGFSGGFADFARGHLPKLQNLARVLETLREALPAEELAVLHYETIREDLVPSLLEAGGIPVESLDLSPGGSSAMPRNRSLSPGEISLLRRVNAEFGADSAPMLAQLLEGRPGPSYGRGVVEDEALELLTDQFASEVKTINAVHFGGSQRLEIIDSRTGSATTPDAESIRQDERSAAGFLLAELSSAVNRIRFRRIRAMLDSLAG